MSPTLLWIDHELKFWIYFKAFHWCCKASRSPLEIQFWTFRSGVANLRVSSLLKLEASLFLKGLSLYPLTGQGAGGKVYKRLDQPITPSQVQDPLQKRRIRMYCCRHPSSMRDLSGTYKALSMQEDGLVSLSEI